MSPETITIRRGTWAEMRRQLLEQAVAKAGSIRKAAPVLGVARSTLANWMRQLRPPRELGKKEAARTIADRPEPTVGPEGPAPTEGILS